MRRSSILQRADDDCWLLLLWVSKRGNLRLLACLLLHLAVVLEENQFEVRNAIIMMTEFLTLSHIIC